jgi:hypothetical protein
MKNHNFQRENRVRQMKITISNVEIAFGTVKIAISSVKIAFGRLKNEFFGLIKIKDENFSRNR